MIERAWALEFAQDWIESWNAHDMERILSHYTDDFEMSSPLIVERLGQSLGVLRGVGRFSSGKKRSMKPLPRYGP